MGRDAKISISVIFQTQTDRAVCIREAEDSDDIWLPLSQIEIDEVTEPLRGEECEIIAPEWLLEAKGLL